MRLSRFVGGCLIINDQDYLVGTLNEDGTMGALPCEVASVFGGGFSGSGGDVQTMRVRVDFGPQDKLVASVVAYRFNGYYESIIPAPE